MCISVINLGSKAFISTTPEMFSGLGFALLGTIWHPGPCWSCGSHLDSHLSSLISTFGAHKTLAHTTLFISYHSAVVAFYLTHIFYCFIIEDLCFLALPVLLFWRKLLDSFKAFGQPTLLWVLSHFHIFSCFRGPWWASTAHFAHATIHICTMNAFSQLAKLLYTFGPIQTSWFSYLCEDVLI